MREADRNFYSLDAWQRAHSFVLDIYKCTAVFPDAEKFGLTSQIRRAVISITANIAEGYERYHYKDKIKFYYISRASLAETQSFLFLARDLGYLTLEKVEQLVYLSKEVRQIISGLIRYTKNKIINN
ncbi:four helix bundle protein [Patescibacteria group bacterium]|nr:four helix bundle protein [Patescibacteria group bacterium]